jgi:hypothetical protein
MTHIPDRPIGFGKLRHQTHLRDRVGRRRIPDLLLEKYTEGLLYEAAQYIIDLEDFIIRQGHSNLEGNIEESNFPAGIAALERAALTLWRYRGCGCGEPNCADFDKMKQADELLARLVKAKRYDDGSGWNMLAECAKRDI